MYCVLLTAYVLMAADRFLFPVLAPDVRRDFGFSLANTGLLSTIFTLGLGTGGLPTGYLLSRFSRKAVLLAGVVIFSAGTALTTISTGFWSMLICLAATGLGMAMLATTMFALAASYFAKYRAAAIGSVNLCYGLGGILGPRLAGVLLSSYRSWRVPMLAFGLSGFAIAGIILLTVRPWFSETQQATEHRENLGGAPRLLNRNTIVLTVLSAMLGLVIYAYLGMYPTFLRESLHYEPRTVGFVMSFYGLGALLSIVGGWLGDRLSPRLVLSGSFFCVAGLGYVLFHAAGTVVTQEILSFAFGVIGSAILYVNLAAYHVKAVRGSLAGRASGMFVTSLYGCAAAAGYLMGAIAGHAGWFLAGEIQISLVSVIGASLALALQPDQISL